VNKHTEPGDNRGGVNKHPEPGDDHSRSNR
jgi:hypothetical protein